MIENLYALLDITWTPCKVYHFGQGCRKIDELQLKYAIWLNIIQQTYNKHLESRLLLI